MRFAAGLTVTGVVGYLIIEALKILLAPVTAWLIATLTVVLKFAAIGVGVLFAATLAIGVGVFLYRRSKKAESSY